MHVNAGDTAWMLAATAMVFFMMPGLAFFYGGLVDERNVLSTMAQSFVAIGIISVLWIVIGYSLVFGPDHAALLAQQIPGNAAQAAEAHARDRDRLVKELARIDLAQRSQITQIDTLDPDPANTAAQAMRQRCYDASPNCRPNARPPRPS